MDTITINFKASGQNLTADAHPQRYASNTVNYIQAVFDLDENWQSFDSVRAVWHNDFACISTVLDVNGACAVPHEVLTNLDEVIVNLVGSNVEGEELVDRMTTYPLRVVIIDAHARICGTETDEVTPSQFEQYVSIVRELVADIKDIDSVELNDDYTLTFYFSDGTETTVGPIRGEQGETGNGIASAVLNDDYTLTLTFTDGTSYTTSSIRGEQGPQGEPGEVTLAQLASVLPTDTASGAIASFPDGSDLFDYLSCICEINPVQDLHGYDKPWVGGAGKNKIDFSQFSTGRTAFGLTSSVSGEYVKFTGTCNSGGGHSWSFLEVPSAQQTIANSASYKAFVISGTAPTINSVYYDSATQTLAINVSGLVTNQTYDFTIGIVAYSDGTAPTAWTPYSNVCPITGWTGCEVSKAGANLFDKTTITSASILDITTGEVVGSSASYCVTDYIKVGQGQTVYIPKTGSIRRWFYDEYKNADTYLNNSQAQAFTPSKDGFIRLTIDLSQVSLDTFQVEMGVSATAYEPYNGTTYPISWQTEAGTVYGGTVDVVTGVLTVTWASDTKQWNEYIAEHAPTGNIFKRRTFQISNNAVSGSDHSITNCIATYNVGTPTTIPFYYVFDNYFYAWLPVDTADDFSLQLVYELATPQTYQLTPTQIHALLGQNNVWADCGDVEVQYKADVQRWVEKMLDA